MHDIQHCFICRPSDSIVAEDAGFEPRIVAKTAYLLASRRSNHSARSNFLSFFSPTCRSCVEIYVLMGTTLTKTKELATDLLKNVEVVKELVKQQVHTLTEKMVFLR
jgi:hypothetical protein